MSGINEFLKWGHEKTKTTLLHVEERKIFLPFRDIQELQPVDLDKARSRDEVALILKQEIEFKRIKGAVNLYTNPQPWKKDFLTPLGNVYLTRTYSDGSSHITEAPCLIGIEFEAKTQEQFEILQDYQAQVFLNDDVYYLDCDGEVDSEFAFHEFKKRNRVFIHEWDTKDKDGQEVEVYLPQNAKVLSTIKMRIINYDDDNNNNDKLDIALSPTPEALKIS